jgi:non-specific serine/threonine protein kinase
VLDNCEHVLQPCVDLVMAVLEASADTRFLLTSREPLTVPGELVWRLPSLATPGPTARWRALAGQFKPTAATRAGMP